LVTDAPTRDPKVVDHTAERPGGRARQRRVNRTLPG